MKNFIKFTGIWGLLLLTGFNNLTPKYNMVKKIILDAGHGGKDPGALGKISKEKDITLKVVLELGKIIQKNMKGVTVLYTRQKDEFIPIYQRAQDTNRHNTDVFISVHCNSAKNKSVSGVEVFVMGLDSNEKNLAIAKRENATILIEDDRNEHYQDFDPQSPESHIVFSLYQHAYTENSLKLAQCIERSVTVCTGQKSRGVKQAPFVVLSQTTCPSVLVEVGFISNPEEEKFLTKQTGQKRIAQAIFDGFKKYKSTIEASGVIRGSNDFSF